MQTETMILRIQVQAPLTTKGSELTWEEADNNLIKIYQDFLAKRLAASVPDWDAGTVYVLTQAANYNSRTWRYVNGTPSAGTIPGTDPDTWAEVDPTVLISEPGTDSELGKYTPYNITAQDLKEMYDARPVRFTGQIDKAQINNLNATPQLIYSVPAGKGLQFFGGAPVMKTFADGVGFTSASGEFLQIVGDISGTPSVMCFWTDGDIQGPDAPYAAFVPNYRIVTGDIYLSASFPISGGGAAATIDYEVFFREVTL